MNVRFETQKAQLLARCRGLLQSKCKDAAKHIISLSARLFNLNDIKCCTAYLDAVQSGKTCKLEDYCEPPTKKRLITYKAELTKRYYYRNMNDGNDFLDINRNVSNTATIEDAVEQITILREKRRKNNPILK